MEDTKETRSKYNKTNERHETTETVIAFTGLSPMRPGQEEELTPIPNQRLSSIDNYSQSIRPAPMPSSRWPMHNHSVVIFEGFLFCFVFVFLFIYFGLNVLSWLFFFFEKSWSFVHILQSLVLSFYLISLCVSTSVCASCTFTLAIFACLFILPHSGSFLFYFTLSSDACWISKKREKEWVWIWVGGDGGGSREVGVGEIEIRIYCNKILILFNKRFKKKIDFCKNY